MLAFSILGTYLNFGELLCNFNSLNYLFGRGHYHHFRPDNSLLSGHRESPVHCRMSHSISGLYLKNVIPPPAVTIQYVSSKHLLRRKPTLVDRSWFRRMKSDTAALLQH